MFYRDFQEQNEHRLQWQQILYLLQMVDVTAIHALSQFFEPF
jgi:hypothetical protein